MPTMTWKFVDQPIASPAVAVDMNNSAIVIDMGKPFKMDSPPLRRQFNQNAMVDGAFLTSASFDNRVLEFSLAFQGDLLTKATNMNRVLAELAKPNNLIMYRPNATMPPVFFRTFRSDDFAIVNRGGSKAAWSLDCRVIAEPFAIGLRVDLVTGAVVTNNPASGTNPMRLDITGIVGDVASPAFVRLTSLSAAGRLVIAQRSQNNPTAVTVFGQAEAGTLGTDSTIQVNDPLFSGSGSNFVRCLFTTNGIISRVTFPIPTASSSEALKGKYRIFVRLRAAGVAATTYRMRYQTNVTDFSPGPMVTLNTASTAFTHVDLGIIEFPLTTTAPTKLGYSGLIPGHVATGGIKFQATRDSGTANLDIDYMYLVPADEAMCAVGQGAASGFLILDGPNDMTYGMAAGTTPFGATRTVDNGGGLVSRIGGLPILVPGVTNRWHIIDVDDTITATNTIDISYWPRWYEVATS